MYLLTGLCVAALYMQTCFYVMANTAEYISNVFGVLVIFVLIV